MPPQMPENGICGLTRSGLLRRKFRYILFDDI
jgi:hypothetical protein